MVNLDRNQTTLLYMKKYCKDISATLEMFGYNYEEFESNRIFRNAISMPLLQIGELANHFKDDYQQETESEINWNAIIGMRNRFAHGYGSMDKYTIYNTAVNDIPILEKFIDKELKRLSIEIESDQDNGDIDI